MVAAAAVLLISGDLQGHFKVNRNLSLQQVPQFCHKLGVYPRRRWGWALPETRGWAQLHFSIQKRRKEKQKSAAGAVAHASPGSRAEQVSTVQGREWPPPEPAGPCPAPTGGVCRKAGPARMDKPGTLGTQSCSMPPLSLQ